MPGKGKPLHIYNDLYNLLMEYFPDHRTSGGFFDVPGFAKDLGLSHETVYRALRHDSLKIRVALEILRLSHDRHPEMPLYWENLIRFALPEFKQYSDGSASC